MSDAGGLAALLDGKRIVICAGSGGVGKTTTAAAIAMGMAARGARVAVVTIDPARRLADALGLDALTDEPRLVDPSRFAGHGVRVTGELWAMTLDSKRTFDALIERLAPDAAARDEVLANRIYQQLSTAVAGSQEFTGIAKLYELDAEGDYDLVVLDTPPSRNALDFLDAPGRLIGFFQGRAIRLFLRPAGVGGRLMSAGAGAVFAVMQRATGVDLLADVAAFFRALGGMVDGFTDRARHVEALLADAGTTFVVVSSPAAAPSDEAVFLARRLRRAGMPLGALVVNRVAQAEPGLPVASGQLTEALGPDLAHRAADAAARHARAAERDAEGVTRLVARAGHPPTLVVPQLADDVHDVEGLARVAVHLL